MWDNRYSRYVVHLSFSKQHQSINFISHRAAADCECAKICLLSDIILPFHEYVLRVMCVLQAIQMNSQNNTQTYNNARIKTKICRLTL